MKNTTKKLSLEQKVDKILKLLENFAKNKEIASSDFFSKEELYKEICDTVASLDAVSTSYLQRKFSIGYARACRIIDELEKDGLVSKVRRIEGREVLKKKTK